MEYPVLQPYVLLGLEKGIRGNIHFLTNDEVIYPVGTVVTIHNYADKKQRYIKLAERGKNLTQINVSPNKKMIAISEKSEKGPVITLWDPVIFRKRKTLTIPADKQCQATEFAHFQFSYDSKYIVAITGEPDWTLYNIKCEKGRLESSARAINLNGTGTIEEVSCNPNDTNQVALCGDQVLRCMGCVDFIWRQFGYNKLDPAHYTSCAWLSQDRLIVGSNKGKIMILETGEVRAVFHASDLPLINMKMASEEDGGLITDPAYYDNFGFDIAPSKENYEIKSITVFPRGFAFGYNNGKIHVYENETQHRYTRRGFFLIPDRSIERDNEEEPETITTVNSIAINPFGDRILVSCNEMQLWTERIFAHDAYTGRAIDMKPFGYEQHLGPIADIAVCRWKPIALSIGALDRTVKVWNYETVTIELIQVFEDDIYSVDLHPTGLYAIMGFSDKLRFMTLMIDEIIITKEFNVRACAKCRFSRLGHLFAATNANVIQVFSTVTFELMYSLKGHNSHITGLDWCANDSTLASCGVEGALYLWEVVKSARVSETVVKTNPATGIRILNDGKGFYSVGKDGHIREIMNAVVQRDVCMPVSTHIDVLILSALDNMMFITANNGTIFIIQLPLLEKAEYSEVTLHRSSVLKAVLSFDDKHLISGSEDGCIFFWKLVNAEDKAISKFEFISYNEILISKQILDEKMEQIKNLTLRMNELENEHSYQMKQNDALAASKLKDIHESYCSAIEDLKLKNEQMEGDHIQEINNINSIIAKMKRDHTDFIEKLEASYNEKLMSEYEKFLAYEQKMDAMIKDAQKRYEDLLKAKEAGEISLIEDYSNQLAEKGAEYDKLMNDHLQQAKEHEMIKQQIEDDADREIFELKETQQMKLKEEQDTNMRLISDISNMKKQYVVAQREVEEYKQKVFSMENEQTKYKGFIMSLEQDINDMKKEIQERDQTIEEKEKRIFSLKNKNQELEKFKFILDFKIKELKSEIEPKERTITEQTTQINKMVRELENLQKIILGLDLQLEQLREKLNASNNEVKKEMDKNRLMKKSLQDIRIDIHQASGLIQNIPLLQKVVRNMYHKYNADKDFEVAQQEDTEAKSEFLRQRDFLERAVSTLHYQATKNTNSLSYDKVRLVDENAALLEETNLLRKNLQSEVEQNRKLTSLAGMSRMTAQQAQQRVNFATATNKEIHKQYKESLEQNAKSLTAMKNENFRLLTKITEMDTEKK